MKKEMICGSAFEELSNEEMQQYNGGIFQSLSPMIAATTLPCGVGASASCVAVSVYYAVK